jgi:hypothetical protein
MGYYININNVQIGIFGHVLSPSTTEWQVNSGFSRNFTRGPNINKNNFFMNFALTIFFFQKNSLCSYYKN